MNLTKAFFEEIRELIHAARATARKGVDLVQVRTNFEIGRRIVEQEQHGEDRAAYGKEVLKALSDKLTVEFGRGFSQSNLEYMRKFFLLYQDRELISQSATGILQPAITESPGPPISRSLTGKSSPSTGRPFTLSWTHYTFLLSIKNSDERSFYEIEAADQNWTVRELKRQFDSSLYERLALSRDKDGIRRLASEGQTVTQPQDLWKEPLVLEFLGLEERHRYTESDLESAILDRLEHFLLELGKGFLFEARQRRFTFDGEHYFIDLVFYNRLLRCYVLIDLKLGRLPHEHLGQMQMYVNYFDREVTVDGETPTIGIILCRQKNEALVEITLPAGASIHAREYQLYLPSKEELQNKLVEWVREEEAKDE